MGIGVWWSNSTKRRDKRFSAFTTDGSMFTTDDTMLSSIGYNENKRSTSDEVNVLYIKLL
jgi:hypothetical protein